MSNTRSKKAERRRERARRDLATKGVTAVAIGAAMLTLPAVLRVPVLASVGPALRPLGWMALGVGALLLGVHFVSRKRAPSAQLGAPSVSTTMLPPEPAAGNASESVFAPLAPPGHWQEAQWGSAVFAAIEWRRFEALCEAFYAQAGLQTRSQSHGADGGVDIWLQSKHMPEPRIVQCKHWKSKPVGVKELREFRGVMASHGLKHGTYVTSSTFTAEAAAFAKSNRIQTQDGAALLKLIGQRTQQEQEDLLAVAYQGEYWRPTCASCGVKMVERESRRAKGSFWGCANYPRCRGKSIAKPTQPAALAA